MDEYIPLTTVSTSGSEESLFNQPSTSTGVRRRGGYVEIPINSSNSSLSSAGSFSKTKTTPIPRVTAPALAAGTTLQHIAEGHLGASASDPNNPLSEAIFGNRDDYYAAVPLELRRLNLADRQKLIKPYGIDWDKDSKAKYSQHWRLVNPRRGQSKIKKQEQRDSANLARGQPQNYGLTLPFSNNIGPGNPIGPALTPSDAIAQGHDLHYQDSQKPSDVLQADREAISHFAYEAVAGKNPISQLQAAAGAVGLGIKHVAELASGQQLCKYGKVESQSSIYASKLGSYERRAKEICYGTI